MKVRALVSSEGWENLFNLRCEVRENLVGFLRSLGGGTYLPHDRSVDLSAAVTALASASGEVHANISNPPPTRAVSS